LDILRDSHETVKQDLKEAFVAHEDLGDKTAKEHAPALLEQQAVANETADINETFVVSAKHHPLVLAKPVVKVVTELVNQVADKSREHLEEQMQKDLNKHDPTGFAQYEVVCFYMKVVMWKLSASPILPDAAECTEVGDHMNLKETLFDQAQSAGFFQNGILEIYAKKNEGLMGALMGNENVGRLIDKQGHAIGTLASIVKRLLNCANNVWTQGDDPLKNLVFGLTQEIVKHPGQRIHWAATGMLSSTYLSFAKPPCQPDAPWAVGTWGYFSRTKKAFAIDPIATFDITAFKNTAVVTYMFGGQYWKMQQEGKAWDVECHDGVATSITVNDLGADAKTAKTFEWFLEDQKWVSDATNDMAFYLSKM
jgi:hypothetical protein